MLPKYFQELIRYFSFLPAVGPKMAERLVLYLFKQDKFKVTDFAQALLDFQKKLSFCPRCHYITESGKLCSICSQSKRVENKIICVVEEPLNVMAFEKAGVFSGTYHVLGGSLSVMTPDAIGKLKIDELILRIKKEQIKEVILATNLTSDGETTALYLARMIRPLNVKMTRLARGLPTGGDIEYADSLTLSGALEGRREVK